MWWLTVIFFLVADVVGVFTVGVLYRGICALSIRSSVITVIDHFCAMGLGIAQIVWLLVNRDLFKSFSAIDFSDTKAFFLDYAFQPPVLVLFGLILLSGLFLFAPDFESRIGSYFAFACIMLAAEVFTSLSIITNTIMNWKWAPVITSGAAVPRDVAMEIKWAWATLLAPGGSVVLFSAISIYDDFH